MHNVAYKFRLYPNKSQEDLLQKHFGHCRFIYNHFLAVKIKHYKETKKTLNWQDMATELPKLKKTNEWLSDIGSQSLQQSIINLDRHIQHFSVPMLDFQSSNQRNMLKNRSSFQ